MVDRTRTRNRGRRPSCASALSFAGVGLTDRSGSRTVFIGEGTAIADRYETGMGDFDLVLSDFPGDLATSVEVGVGNLTVVVPDDAQVQIDARVGLGAIDAFGSSRSGYRRRLILDDQPDGEHLIKLRLRVGLGEIDVRRASLANVPFIDLSLPGSDLPPGRRCSGQAVLRRRHRVVRGRLDRFRRRHQDRGQRHLHDPDRRAAPRRLGSTRKWCGGSDRWRHRQPRRLRDPARCHLRRAAGSVVNRVHHITHNSRHRGAAVKTHRFDPVSLALGIVAIILGIVAINSRLGNVVNDRPDALVPLLLLGARHRGDRRARRSDHFKMLTARATTSTTVPSDTTDCSIIAIFAQRTNGKVSVGLNAAALVNDR